MLTVFQQCASEKEYFRQVMGRFATGITVVTTNYRGSLWGLTVNSFCSVSLCPPLILICIHLTSRALPLIRRSKVFAVNVLTDQQEQLSQRFATMAQERADCFKHVSYGTAVTGAPILDGAHAFVDTQVVAEYAGGDHIILLGQVVALGMAGRVAFLSGGESTLLSEQEGDRADDEQFPLLYYRGQYHRLQRPETPHW